MFISYLKSTTSFPAESLSLSLYFSVYPFTQLSLTCLHKCCTDLGLELLHTDLYWSNPAITNPQIPVHVADGTAVKL